MERRRHDGMGNTLSEELENNGRQFVLYGDPENSARAFLYIPFTEYSLSPGHKAFKTATAKSREW